MTRSTAGILARTSGVIAVTGILVTVALKSAGMEDAHADPRSQGKAEGYACGLLLLCIVGLSFGFVALRATKRFGPNEIRTPAIVGLALNSIWLVVTIATLARVFRP